MSEIDEYDYIYKVTLIGDSAVGKTSLSKSGIQQIFNSNYKTTIGVDFVSKTYVLDCGTKIKLQLWDTAGQERYRAVTRAYYTNAAGVIILFDITNRISYDHVEYWKKELMDHTNKNIPILVIGNKSDLANSREVTTLEAMNYCAKNNFMYEELSARSESTAVSDAFRRFVNTIYTSIKTDMGRVGRVGSMGREGRENNVIKMDAPVNTEIKNYDIQKGEVSEGVRIVLTNKPPTKKNCCK
jgi:small GTP-binding protein